MGSAEISVIVPVYNAEAYIAEALDSILGQTHPPREIIVIDDGSTDGTQEVVSQYRNAVICLRQENRGPAAARNTGLERATGRLIAFLDADDLWPPDALAESSRVLQENPEIGVVLGRTRFLRRVDRPDAGAQWQDSLVARFYPQLGSALFRRAVFDEVGAFDAHLAYSEDIDWFIRARERGVHIHATERISLIHRLHSGNMTGAVNPADFRLAAVLKRSLDRRRTAGPGRAEQLPQFGFPPRPDPET